MLADLRAYKRHAAAAVAAAGIAGVSSSVESFVTVPADGISHLAQASKQGQVYTLLPAFVTPRCPLRPGLRARVVSAPRPEFISCAPVRAATLCSL